MPERPPDFKEMAKKQAGQLEFESQSSSPWRLDCPDLRRIGEGLELSGALRSGRQKPGETGSLCRNQAHMFPPITALCVVRRCSKFCSRIGQVGAEGRGSRSASNRRAAQIQVASQLGLPGRATRSVVATARAATPAREVQKQVQASCQ
jgi:hypothetical protein